MTMYGKYDPMTSFLIKNPNLDRASNTLRIERLNREYARPKHLVHDPHVRLYRANKTHKCPIEIDAALARAHIQFGSAEHQAIKRTCDSSDCHAKYHWCPTCFLAPRCDCKMPHMTPSIVSDTSYPKTVWHPDQSYLIQHMELIACDDRYGTFVQSVRLVAQEFESIISPFCIDCTGHIRKHAIKIIEVSGRTYLEQASNLWQIIGPLVCESCIGIINEFPCMHSGTKCPSTFLKLISTRLINYRPRHSVDKSKEYQKRANGLQKSAITTSGQPRTNPSACRFEKLRPNFSRAPGPASGKMRSPYPTTDICTENPPWTQNSMRHVQSNKWINFPEINNTSNSAENRQDSTPI